MRLAGLSLGPSVSREVEGCPDAGFFATFRPTDADYSFDDRRTVLSSLAGSDLGSSGPAATLLAAADTLGPTPRYSLEALGRMLFADEPGTTELLTNLNDDVETDCGTTVVDDDWIASRLGGVTPARTATGTAVENAYGRCDESVGWVGERQVLWCGDEGERAIVDTAGGVLTYLPPPGLVPDDVGPNGPPRSNFPVPFAALGGVAWLSQPYSPASGLTAQRWVTTLHAADLDGQVLLTATVATDPEPGNQPASTGTPGAVILSGSAGTTAYGGAGTVLWRRKPLYIDHQSSAHTVVTDDEILNSTTGEVVDGACYGGAASKDACAVSVLGDRTIMLDPIDQTPSTVKLGALPREALNDPAPSVVILIDHDSERGPSAHTTSGRRLWRLSADLVRDYLILGRFVDIGNESGEEVVVDSESGEDVTADQRSVADLVAGADAAPVLVGRTSDGGLVFEVEVDGTTLVRKAPLSVCSIN